LTRHSLVGTEPLCASSAWPTEPGIGVSDPDWDEDDDALDVSTTKPSRLGPGDEFLYVFDFGDDWHHLCTVGSEKVDPLEVLGIRPAAPLPYFGWGDLPDQYGRRGRMTTEATDPSLQTHVALTCRPCSPGGAKGPTSTRIEG
jgi:hypothetical protein